MLKLNKKYKVCKLNNMLKLNKKYKVCKLNKSHEVCNLLCLSPNKIKLI